MFVEDCLPETTPLICTRYTSFVDLISCRIANLWKQRKLSPSKISRYTVNCMYSNGWLVTLLWAHRKLSLFANERRAPHRSRSPAQNTTWCWSEMSSVVRLGTDESRSLREHSSRPWCVWLRCVWQLLSFEGLWWHRRHRFPCDGPGRPVRVCDVCGVWCGCKYIAL